MRPFRLLRFLRLVSLSAMAVVMFKVLNGSTIPSNSSVSVPVHMIDEQHRAPEPVINDNLWEETTIQYGDKKSPPLCQHPPPELVGTIPVNLTEPESLDSIASVLHASPSMIGGRWRPGNCTSRSRLAVVMSYRDRLKNLKLILQHLHPFLQKQLIEYQMFVVEPHDDLTFNRGLLKNIGFMEAMRVGGFTCVVFQDIDLLPENDQNLYHCHEIPRHLVVSIDTKKYEPLAEGAIFGGAVLFRSDHFREVNGYSNLYFDWGAEDDDLMCRVENSKLNYSRPANEIGRFREAVHKRDTKRPTVNVDLLKLREKRWRIEGLNSLPYKVIYIKEYPTHTLLKVFYNETLYQKQIEAVAR